MDPYLSSIYIFGFSFEPTGFATCNGALLSISQNSALFSLLGITFGGNGSQNFGLPDLRGRTPIGIGQGIGLANIYTWGQMGGVETVTLTINQMPQHNHQAVFTPVASSATLGASTKAGTTNVPGSSAVPAALPTIGAGVNTIQINGYSSTNVDTSIPVSSSGGAGAVTIGLTGGSQPHENMSPYLAMNFCIATSGVYPSRN
jgi:microcystin-dependent protein